MGTQLCSILSSGDVSRGPRMQQLPDPGQRTEGPRAAPPPIRSAGAQSWSVPVWEEERGGCSEEQDTSQRGRQGAGGTGWPRWGLGCDPQ